MKLNIEMVYTRSWLLITLLPVLLFCGEVQAQRDTIRWGKTVVVNNTPSTEGARGTYGSEYARLVRLSRRTWLAAYTVADSHKDSLGVYRLHLEIAQSRNCGRSWRKISELAYSGRDMDNAQMVRLKDGRLLLACRSTRFGETYWLPVYLSTDKGVTWEPQSLIERNEGAPGTLSHLDKGLYEPHLVVLDDGRVAVQYANEKHVTDSASYSQIISEKVSNDNGKTWGKEIWAVYEPGNASSRPGMPVWTRMANGAYMLVYEVCGPQGCNVYYKTSTDGKEWLLGLGTLIPGQTGGPFIVSLSDGRLVVTSNRANISISHDYGKSWVLAERPWKHRQPFEQLWYQTYWPSLYQTGRREVAAVASVLREQGGHNVQVRFGKIKRKKQVLTAE